jgi:hypothetical protein
MILRKHRKGHVGQVSGMRLVMYSPTSDADLEFNCEVLQSRGYHLTAWGVIRPLASLVI